jgi:PKD repeat protein
MSNAAAPAKKGFGFIKAALGGGVGLATGVIGVYATAIVDQVAKPPKPVANFAVAHDGLTITCQNRASGQSGWWDFGDGSPLEPFAADQTDVPHTYAKAGSYSVKLTVRNFLMEENERAVPVDVTTASSGTAGGPTITGLTVEPIGSGTAPATFRVKCEVKNAQQMILDLGSGERPEVVTANGPFEKLVVYEQTGVYPLQMYAMSGAKLEKQWKPVNVAAPAPGALSVVVRVTDSGTRTERKNGRAMAVIPMPAKPAGKFEKDVKAEPGWTLASAQLDKYENKAVKNLKVDVSADRTAAKVSGEWTGSTEAANRAAGGSDPMVPVLLVQERATPLVATPRPVAAQLVAASIFDSFESRGQDWNTNQKTATLPLPPLPAGANVKRTISLMLHEIDSRGKDAVVLSVPALTKPVEEQVVTLSNKQRQVVRWEQLANGQLRVTAKPVPAVASR